MNTTINDKLSGVPYHVVLKFENEVLKAKRDFYLYLQRHLIDKDEKQQEHFINIAKEKLVKRYKQLIRLHLKKYGVNHL